MSQTIKKDMFRFRKFQVSGTPVLDVDVEDSEVNALFTMSPTDPHDTCNWQFVNFSPRVGRVNLHRYNMGFELDVGDGGLLCGLNLPSTVKALHVMDSAKRKCTMRSRIVTGGGLVVFEAENIDWWSAFRVCKQSPKLSTLTLRDMSLSGLNWPPMCNPLLTSLEINGCGLTKLPLQLCSAFPLLESLALYGNNINTLRGVVLPYNLSQLRIEGACLGDEFSRLELPRGLTHLTVSHCGIGWISRKFVLPSGLRHLNVSYNPEIRLTAFRNAFHSRCMRYISHSVIGLNFTVTYCHQDTITLFVHNRVLPLELLRLVYTCLP